MEFLALKVGKPRPTSVVRGGITQVNRKHIQQYQKEIETARKTDGWEELLECEQKELEMHTEFARILKSANF